MISILTNTATRPEMPVSRAVFRCLRPQFEPIRPGAVSITRSFATTPWRKDRGSKSQSAPTSTGGLPRDGTSNALIGLGIALEDSAKANMVKGPEGSRAQSLGDLGVGEMDGGKFKIEPLRRTGEDVATMRARLLCM
jgi:hypothetical protein